MTETPDLKEQILQSHAGLIHRVVMHCNNPGAVPDLEEVLRQAQENNWTRLVAAIREVMAGRRDQSVLLGLDEEDRTIVESILLGLQDPSTLPDLEADFDSSLAAPGIASLIHASRQGNAHALQLVANMARQMLTVGGDMGILAGRIRPLVEGERDADTLSANMSGKGQELMVKILDELLKLEAS